MKDQQQVVFAGVDTHKDTHYAAVITTTGQHLEAAPFPTTPAGYEALRAFITSFGALGGVGVEGTNSYGAGLARHLHDAGLSVTEVLRPKRHTRRMNGKSDEIDAYAAAHTVSSGQGCSTPKSGCGAVEQMRIIQAARRSAIKASTEATLQIRDLLVTAPPSLRSHYARLSTPRRVSALAHARGSSHDDSLTRITRETLRRLAQRVCALNKEAAQADQTLKALITQTNPALLQARGVGVETAAQLLIAAGDNPQRIHSEAAFAMMCGVAPIPASSGLTTRHRLNRGGNRDANSALYHIAIVRLSCDKRTQAYATRRQAQGKTKKDVIRCLKRAIAREVYHLIVNPPQALDTTELRQLRQDAGLTLTQASIDLDCSTAHLSHLERGYSTSTEAINQYRDYLTHRQTPQTAA